MRQRHGQQRRGHRGEEQRHGRQRGEERFGSGRGKDCDCKGRGCGGCRGGDCGKLSYIPPCGWNGWDGCTPALGPCGPWVKNCAPYFGCGSSDGGCGPCGPYDDFGGCGIPAAFNPLARRAVRGFAPRFGAAALSSFAPFGGSLLPPRFPVPPPSPPPPPRMPVPPWRLVMVQTPYGPQLAYVPNFQVPR